MVIASPPRRTEGVQKTGRAAAVVQRVLTATAHELARVGYEGLRFEDVAERSHVHKTTIYRRWPTRVKLVEATLTTFMVPATVPARGDVTSNLAAVLSELARSARSELWRGILRMIQGERSHPELAPMLRTLHERKREAHAEVIRRAVSQGELPPDTDAHLIVEMLTGALLSRVIGRGESVDEAWIERAVAVVVAGAKAGGASTHSASSSPTLRKKRRASSS